MTLRKNKANVLQVPVDKIVADHLYQMRAKGVDDAVATQYAVLLQQGVDLCGGADRPTAFVDDDVKYHLGDGFHRLKAHRLVGRETMTCEVRSGGPREAWLHALGANGTHGVPRSRADVRKAIGTALDDEELSAKSDRDLAGILNVSHTTIANHRRRREEEDSTPEPAEPTKSDQPTKLSPAMAQYQRFKQQHPDYVLFFRMGDFYELFHEDAELAHEVMGVTVTTRNGVPMAGVPHHSVENYLKKMIAAGHRVAMCEQKQDPKEANIPVEREVSRLVTPEDDVPVADGAVEPTEQKIGALRRLYPSHVLLFEQRDGTLLAIGKDDVGVLHRVLQSAVREDEFGDPIASLVGRNRQPGVAKLIRNDVRVMIVDAEDLSVRSVVSIDHPYHPDYDPNQTTIEQRQGDYETDKIATELREVFFKDSGSGKVATELSDGPLRTAWAGTSTAEVIDLLGGDESDAVTALTEANVLAYITDVEARYFSGMSKDNQAGTLRAVAYGEGPTLMAACGRSEDESYASDRLKKAEVQFACQEYRDRMWQYRHYLRGEICRTLAGRPSAAAGVLAAEGSATIRGLIHEQDGSTGIWRPIIKREAAVLRAAVVGVSSDSGAIEADAAEACAQGDALHMLGDSPLGVLLHLADLLGLEVPELPTLRGIVDETIAANPQAAKIGVRKTAATTKVKNSPKGKNPANKKPRKAAKSAA